jgi:hypothetical protein
MENCVSQETPVIVSAGSETGQRGCSTRWAKTLGHFVKSQVLHNRESSALQ